MNSAATSNKTPTTQMPLDVLAITCESRPQAAHRAGLSRADHLTAKLGTAACWQ